MRKKYQYVALLAFIMSQCTYAQGPMGEASDVPNTTAALDRFATCFVDDSSESLCWQQMLTESNPAVRYDFGAHYANGDGVKQDFTKGRYWIHQAALKGYPLAQYNLGVMFFDGIGGMQSQECAVHWLNKAASEDDETREMAQQALAALAELTTAVEASPKVYRLLTDKECEQLPDVIFPGWEIDVPQNEPEFESLPELAEPEPHRDASITFNIGLDVLSTNLPAEPFVGASLLPFKHEPEAELASPSIFREKMGHYFIQLGHQLLGQKPDAALNDNLHERVEMRVTNTSSPVVLPDERDRIEMGDIDDVLLEKLISVPADVPLPQAEPLFIARILDHPVGTPYDQLDVMAKNSGVVEDDVFHETQVIEDILPSLSTSATPSVSVDLASPEMVDNRLQVNENTAETAPVAVLPTVIPPQAPAAVVPVSPTIPKMTAKTAEKKVPPALNLGGALRSASKGHYTLQLSSASQAEPLLALARKQKLSNYLVYETQRHGRRWYVLVYGEYAGMTQAKQALQQLPVSLKKDVPWVRSLGHVQREL